MAQQNTSHAVMIQRPSPKDGADFFPTPPWATRALCEQMDADLSGMSAWDPAAGAGHMIRPLREYFGQVTGTDLHDYGDPSVMPHFDFLGPYENAPLVNWIITNPPFNLAEQFAHKAIQIARTGVALLVRSTFLETVGRYKRLFDPDPPFKIYQFSERVPMHKGKLDRNGSTATAYCWVVWYRPQGVNPYGGDGCALTEFEWIGPCRKRLERDEDYE
jgi:hypothetical protein